LSLEREAELLMIVENYDCYEREKWDRGIDFTVSDDKSDDKILIRIINEPKSKSGFVGVETVAKMIEDIKNGDYDKGFLVSKRFTEAAKRKTYHENIQLVTENFAQRFKPQTLYFAIKDCVDDLCKIRCGKIPKKESDCKGYIDDVYSCKIRVVSDNAFFHLEHGWKNLLINDLMQLLKMKSRIHN